MPTFPFVFGLPYSQASVSCKNRQTSDQSKQGILLALGLFSHHPGSWFRTVLHHCLGDPEDGQEMPWSYF